MKNRMAFALRGCVAIATASLLGTSFAHAQPGPTSGLAGGPSDGYAGLPAEPPASRQNTPSTGGGPTTLTDRSTRDEAAANPDARSRGTVTGRVEKLDPANHTLQLSGMNRTLKVDPTVEVTRNGDQATFSDIKEGDQVRASFSGTGSDRAVTHIDLLGANDTGTSSRSTGTGSSADTAPPASSSAPSDTR